MKKIIRIENLDCADCALQLEGKLKKIDGVNDININFMALKMNLDVDDQKYNTVVEEIKKVTSKFEPEICYKGL